MTGTNSVFYGNVNMYNNNISNVNTLSITSLASASPGNYINILSNLSINNSSVIDFNGNGGIVNIPDIGSYGNLNIHASSYAPNTATISLTANSNVNITSLGTISNIGVASFTSTVKLTGGLTNYLSNSGLFSNAGISRFASNVFLTGGTNASGLSINSTSNINYLQIHGDTLTSQSTAPDGGGNFPIVITSPKATAGSIYAMALGVDYTTGFGFINGAGAGATQPILLNSRGGNIGVNCNAPAYQLDVNGIARASIPVSNIALNPTLTSASNGIYYYITNSAFSAITLPSSGVTSGWFVTLRNNTGSYLSITIGGGTATLPASPFTIPPSNSVTIAYDGASGVNTWIYF